MFERADLDSSGAVSYRSYLYEGRNLSSKKM